MANVLFWKMQFVASNPFGEYVAGDELTFYYDNTVPIPGGGSLESSGISVYKNGVLASSGADISISVFANQGILVEQNLVNDYICNGTYGVYPSRLYASFPYFVNIYYSDYPSCAVNPPTCDLIIVGTPLVVPASAENQADGEITITATSSEPKQYKLGSDFVYNDGTGHQSTGEFTGLFPGSYRIYVRDAKNCFANVLVSVGFDNNYGPFYRLEYDDIIGGVTRIDISKRAYSGAITEICGAGTPYQRTLKGEGSIDKFEPSILSTQATVNLTSETDFQFSVLYTNSPEEFRIYTYKNSSLKGIYKVLPQQGGEDYKAPPYYFTLIATDGLPSLRDIPFLQDDGQRFNGSMKSIELIAYILRKTRLELNIRCGINMYAIGMNTTDSDDPLDQAYVDTDQYYLTFTDPTLDDVLRAIIEPYGARLLQENAVWNILRVEELVGSFDYREFDENGIYVSDSSYDPVVDVDSPEATNRFMFALSDHFQQRCPGYGKIRAFYKLGLRDNILENGDFRLKTTFLPPNTYAAALDTFGFQLVNSDYPITSTWEDIEDNNVAWKISGDFNLTLNTGNAYIQSDSYTIKMGAANTLKISIRYKIPAPVAYGITPIPINIPYQKVRVRVKYGSFYLLTDGTWTTEENIISIYVTEYDKFLQTEFVAVQPDAGASSGYAFDVRLYHSFIYHAEYSDYDDLRARETYDGVDPVLPNGTRTEVSTNPATGQDLNYYELEENTDAENEPLIVRPDDYHVTNNPRQWIRKQRLVKTYFTSFTSPFWVDKIQVEFLTSGERSADTIIREANAEPRNTAVLEKVATHGSYQSLITTIPAVTLNLMFGSGTSASFTLTTTNILSADILYAGYLRNSSGVGWENWARDGQSESTSLHEILLRQYAAQYRKSWRKMNGSFYSDDIYFSFIDVLRIVSDNNRIYLPMSPTIDDKANIVSGEFVELTDITQAGESASAFTRGFKQSGFR